MCYKISPPEAKKPNNVTANRNVNQTQSKKKKKKNDKVVEKVDVGNNINTKFI